MITAHVERFEANLDYLKPLLPIHYKELALNQDKVPLSPQFDKYIAAEHCGELLFVGLRSAGELVGYFIGFVAPGLHYSTCLTCQMDIFYVLPEHRGSGAGYQLFKFVEKTLKKRGVQRFFVGSKMHKDASWLFEKLGYTPVETYYSTWLGD
ncbi:GNAT family N-acetyltransferase [Acinetobacter baumannii]|uniref:GNAT family N-acetyltransferase n=1 Tax=Acinetobacter baumannii TaxID=470 RepID=UPI003D03EE2B